MAILPPEAGEDTVITYYVLAATGYAPVLAIADQLTDCSEMFKVPAEDIPESIEAKRAAADEEYKDKGWTFVVWAFTFKLGDGKVWPSAEDFSSVKEVTLDELKEEAIKAIIAAAEEALANPNLQGPQRAQIESIRDIAIAQISNPSVKTEAEVKRLRDNAINAIKAVKDPDTFDVVVNVPDIDAVNGTITLNYYLADGTDELTEEALMALINNNSKGMTFTLVSYTPEEIANDGTVSSGSAVVTCEGARYRVNLTHVYAVTIDGEIEGYVSATDKTLAVEIATGTRYLEVDDIIEAAANYAAEVSGTNFQLKTSTDAIAKVTDDQGNISYTNKAFVTARQVTFDTTNAQFVMIVTDTGASNIPAETVSATSNDSYYIQVGAMLNVTPVVTTGDDLWYALKVGTAQDLSTIKQIPTGAVNAALTSYVNSSLEASANALTIGVDKGALVVVDGTNAGVFATTADADVPTKATGYFVPYIDVTAGTTTATDSSASSATKLEGKGGKIASVPVDVATNLVNNVLTLVPAVELKVPSAAANPGFSGVTATISYGVLEDATLNLDNASAAKTLYIAKGAEVTFTATGLDSIRIDYTAPGAKEPEVTTEKAADDEVTISFENAGSYELTKVVAVNAVAFDLSAELADAAKWGTIGDLTQTPDVGSVTIDSVTRYFQLSEDGKPQVETGGKAILSKAGVGDGLEITLTIEAGDGYYFAENLKITGEDGITISKPVFNADGTVTVTIEYKVVADAANP
jgi:hypothetical protein